MDSSEMGSSARVIGFVTGRRSCAAASHGMKSLYYLCVNVYWAQVHSHADGCSRYAVEAHPRRLCCGLAAAGCRFVLPGKGAAVAAHRRHRFDALVRAIRAICGSTGSENLSCSLRQAPHLSAAARCSLMQHLLNLQVEAPVLQIQQRHNEPHRAWRRPAAR